MCLHCPHGECYHRMKSIHSLGIIAQNSYVMLNKFMAQQNNTTTTTTKTLLISLKKKQGLNNNGTVMSSARLTCTHANVAVSPNTELEGQPKVHLIKLKQPPYECTERFVNQIQSRLPYN